MNRMLVVLGLLLLGLLAACGTPEEVANIEAAEDAEWSAGNERSVIQSEQGGSDGILLAPNTEETVEMQNEPYPE